MNQATDNVLKHIKTLGNFSQNIIFTDPPYQLGSQWYICEKTGEYKLKGAKSDFMQKWDGLDHNDLNLFFKESYRTLKYGGYLLMFGIDRQLGANYYYAHKHGFEVCQSMYWYYISSFPKATDLSLQIDKKLNAKREVVGNVERWGGNASGGRGNQNANDYQPTEIGAKKFDDITIPSSELAKIFDGYKYGIAPLKQTVETILVFRKPSLTNSVLNDVLYFYKNQNNKISPSCLNIDASRVPITQEQRDIINAKASKNPTSNYEKNADKKYGDFALDISYGANDGGRFPPQTFINTDIPKILDNQSGISTSAKVKSCRKAK